MMKDKYKGKNVLQIIYRKMEDEDKSLVDIMKHSNIQEYEKFKYQFNLLLLLGVLCLAPGTSRAQNTYIDVTTTAALKLYSDNLKVNRIKL